MGQMAIHAACRLEYILLHPLLVGLAGFALDDHAQQQISEIGILMALSGSIAKALSHGYGSKHFLVGNLGKMIDIHPVPGAEHGVSPPYGEASFVAQQVLDGNVVIALVRDMVGEEGVVQNAMGPEYLIGKAQLAVFYQFHDSCGGDELAD